MRLSLSHRDYSRKIHPHSSQNTSNDKKIIIWRWKMISLMSVLLVITIFYFFFYSSYFVLTSVTVEESHYIPKYEITAVIDSFLGRRRMLLFRQNNFFTLNKEMLKDLLETQFKLQSVQIIKHSPNDLSITFNEQVAVFLVQTPQDENLRLVDYTGTTIQHIGKEEYNVELPYVVVTADTSINSSLATLVLESWGITNVSHSNYLIISFVEEGDSLKAITNKGFTINYSLTENPEQQIKNLRTLQKEFLKGEPLPLSYVELRFGDKVYIK